MTISILGFIAVIITVAVISFIVAVFVYRNNESLFSPIADRLDAHEDNLQEMISNLKGEIQVLSKKVASFAHQLKEKK